MNRVHIQPPALADICKAARWYDTQQVGLGAKFVLELDAAIARAAEHPMMYEVRFRQARRVLLRRFPYSAYYIHENAVIEVVAVLHQFRADAARQARIP